MATARNRVPPFLKKLVQLTDSCPPEVGGWNDDGTQFVVTSSAFADILREHFQGSLQTFVRQLHFYSFHKKDGQKGVWSFSHPSFVRGKPELLCEIERKPNPKKKNAGNADNGADGEDDDGESPVKVLEERLEAALARISSLEKQVTGLRSELVTVQGAQSLLSLAPEKATEKTAAGGAQKREKSGEGEDMTGIPPRPRKAGRQTSVDSMMELKDFPFEDTSSLGSVSVKDLMRELQTGIFSDFDEFLPAGNNMQTPAAPVNETSSSSNSACGEDVCEFKLPQGFKLLPGVTVSLLKQAFDTIGEICCPDGDLKHACSVNLRKMCDELPHPSDLPALEEDPISLEILPVLKEHLTETATDKQLLSATRQVYEIYYEKVLQKRREKEMQVQRAAAASIPRKGYANPDNKN